MVLAVVTVAEGGAGHVPVRPGHAGETGRAGEEHSTKVQRPHCRDRIQLCHPSLPSVCPPCHQPRTHPEPRGAGRGPCPPPAPAGHWQSPARPRGARPAPAPAAAPPPTAHRSAAPRCPPCGDTHRESAGAGRPAQHCTPALLWPRSVGQSLYTHAGECHTLRDWAITHLIPVTSSRRNPGIGAKRGVTCAGWRELSTMAPSPHPLAPSRTHRLVEAV